MAISHKSKAIHCRPTLKLYSHPEKDGDDMNTDLFKGALDNVLKFYFWLNFIYHVKCNC